MYSVVAVPSYIPTHSGGGFPSLHTLFIVGGFIAGRFF